MTVKSIFGGVLSYGMTDLLVPMMIRLAHKLNAVDNPDGRLKQHTRVTPYLGGMAVYLGFLAALALVFPVSNQLFFMVVGITLLLFVGLIDDLLVLMPSQKFWGQLIAMFCFLRGGFYLKETFFLSLNSLWVTCGVMAMSGLWIVGVINAFNLIDVMDGLAATTAFSIAMILAVIAGLLGSYQVVILLVAFMGALVAFFRYNRPVAQIYLGDSGSLCIGGLLATVPFMIPWGTHTLYGFCVIPLIFFVPLIEVATLILIRTARGIPFYLGSPHHFCHYMKRLGMESWSILLFVSFVHLVLLFSAIACVMNLVTLPVAIGGGFILLLLWNSVVFSPGFSRKQAL